MMIDEKQVRFKARFAQSSFVNFLSVSGAYDSLLNALSDDDIEMLEQKNIFFCRSYAPSSVTELIGIPAVDVVRLIDFEAQDLKTLMPDEIVAIMLHEIGHVANPANDALQNELNADSFAIDRNFSNGLLKSLKTYIQKYPKKFDNEINRSRLKKLVDINTNTEVDEEK